MSDIELHNVDSTSPLIRSLSGELESSEYIETDYGCICVTRIGAEPLSGKPYIVTFHDIGLNFQSNFQAFFNFCDMKLLTQSFSVLNIHAPGQEENAKPLPASFVYPSMDELALMVDSVCKHYGAASFVGIGVGAGANILSRYALMFPEIVDGLLLINPTSTVASWSEWFYQKMNIYSLGGYSYFTGSVHTFPQSLQDYLMWYHFGGVTEELNHDLVRFYKNYFTGHNHNARNLAMFIDSYVRRTDLNIERGGKERNLKCCTLIMCGAFSPHVDDTVHMNGRLDPSKSTWMKLSGCAMVLEEQPNKVCEALRLFLQGLGYALTAYERRRSHRHTSSSSENNDRVHIVENPIQC